jgi:hypothetical protein
VLAQAPSVAQTAQHHITRDSSSIRILDLEDTVPGCAVRVWLGSVVISKIHLQRILSSRVCGYERSWRPALACVSLPSLQLLERESDA